MPYYKQAHGEDSNCVIISPSILSVEPKNLRKVIKELERCEVGSIHVDVMDGRFVPNVSYGVQVFSSIRRYAKVPLEVHLMVQDPSNHIKEFADAGADAIIIHYEASGDKNSILEEIRAFGKRSGIAINPETDFNSVKGHMKYADIILVMSVHPGSGGQKFIPDSLDKIKVARRFIDKGNSGTMIAVDGGINIETGKQACSCGADELVVGTAIINSKSISDSIKEFKKIRRMGKNIPN